MKNPVKMGNYKLAKTVGIFNLPEGETCPGATAFCKKVCYANKRRTLKSPTDPVTLSRHRNLEFSKGPDFVAEMVRIINSKPVKLFRLHESGDFYDQDYVNKWVSICQMCPGTVFLAYTKSFHLDMGRLEGLSNMRLYRSYDPDTRFEEVPAGVPVSYVIPKDKTGGLEILFKQVHGYFICPIKAMHEKKIHGYCGTLCRKCWVGSPKIAFPQH